MDHSPRRDKQKSIPKVSENTMDAAKMLIQKRIEAERAVSSFTKQLDSKRKDIDVQQSLAKKGLDNILAFEKANEAKILLNLLQSEKVLDEINTEIETLKLAAELQKVEEKSRVQENKTQKFYTDEDFNLMIDEFFGLEFFQIDDFLDYHFSLAYAPTSMAKHNWLTALRKNTMNIVCEDEGQKAKMDLLKNWWGNKSSELIAEVNKRYNPKDNASTEEPNNTFDYSNKENYFFPEQVNGFKLIENEMIKKEYINDKAEWNTEKNKLVALIYILIQLKYLRPKIVGKEKNTSILAYRRFFEARYKTTIADQMKPSKFEIGKLKNYKPDFLFIPSIDNI